MMYHTDVEIEAAALAHSSWGNRDADITVRKENTGACRGH